MKQAYSFDDILMVPQYSDIKSRREVDISSKLDGERELDFPIISSPMDTVTELEMMAAMSDYGGMGVLHRYNTLEEQTEIMSKTKEKGVRFPAAAIGMSGDYMERAEALVEAGCQVLCVDVAHGHHAMMKDCLKSLKTKFNNNVHIMAGNVATLEAFDALADWGTDSIRVGIGGGSICSTRIVTGHGVTTLQSVMDIAKTTSSAKIIADGGIRTTGDMVKTLAAGADFVMIGSLFAGTEETPGEVFVNKRGIEYKAYRGMASASAQRDWRGSSSTPEGIATNVPFKGPIRGILNNIAGGLKSGYSYTGARNLAELQSKVKFITQSQAGSVESSTHILRRSM